MFLKIQVDVVPCKGKVASGEHLNWTSPGEGLRVRESTCPNIQSEIATPWLLVKTTWEVWAVIDRSHVRQWLICNGNGFFPDTELRSDSVTRITFQLKWWISIEEKLVVLITSVIRVFPEVLMKSSTVTSGWLLCIDVIFVEIWGALSCLYNGNNTVSRVL